MKSISILLTAVFLCMACEPSKKIEVPKAPFKYAYNIKFNHLYVVIDDSTYKYLFDSIPFFQQFAYVREANVDAGEESWSGKYISGNQDYLEIFKPGGAENTELGDFGIGFMPNLLGTVDSLYDYWKPSSDSIWKDLRNMVIGPGDTIPWFNAVAIHDPDSLAITPWVMEYTDTFMQMAGFTEEDLKREINHAEYSQRGFATRSNIPYDSADYRKLYEKVTALSVTLSKAEYNYFKKYLSDFGFQESESGFSRPDLTINYQLNDADHFILNQIEFELKKEVENQSYAFGSVVFEAQGRKASLLFNVEN